MIPSIIIPAVNAPSASATPETQPTLGYFLNLPPDNIASAPTTAAATNIIAPRPARKTKACGPNTADPKAKAPTPKVVSANPTLSTHFNDGYLLYLPRLKISEVSAITPASITITRPPLRASTGLTNFVTIFIANAIAMATMAIAIPKKIILNIVEKVSLLNDFENFAKIQLDTATASDIKVKRIGSKITFFKLMLPIIFIANAAMIVTMAMAIPINAILNMVIKVIFCRL